MDKKLNPNKVAKAGLANTCIYCGEQTPFVCHRCGEDPARIKRTHEIREAHAKKRDCGEEGCETCLDGYLYATAEEAHEAGEHCGAVDCQDCCEHDERDHGICLDCGHEEDPGEAIDRAMDYMEDR